MTVRFLNVRVLNIASVLTLIAFSLIPPVYAADDAAVDKLTRMIERQQKILDAQSRELNSMRKELNTLRKDQKKIQAGSVVPLAPVPAPAMAAQIPTTRPSSGVMTTNAELSDARKYVEEGSFPGSIRIPGTGASFKIGGQVKMDAMYTPNQTPGLSEDVFFTRSIQSGAVSKTSRSRIMARDTRLNFDLRAPTPYGDLKAFVDFDLFGAAGSTTPQSQLNGYDLRLRNAYVQVGQVLAGQTWSNFNDPVSFAETLDFGQVNGESFVRQPQLRWTSLKHGYFTFAGSIENPEGDISDNTAPGVGRQANADSVPDVIGSVSYDRPWGHLQSAALYRRIKVAGNTLGPAFTDTANGYGVNLGGRISTPFINDGDTFRFQGNYGDGIGRYINDLQNIGTESFDAVVAPSNTQIETLRAFGGYASYQALFNERWRSNVTGGYVSVNQPVFQPGTALSTTTYIATNVIWSPVPKLDVGFEALLGQRSNKDDSNGTATRFITSVKYSF
jgi:Porin subfamily